MRAGVGIAAAVAALLLAGCGTSSGSDGSRTLTVSAAASLTDVFTELESRFEAAHPGVDVRTNYGASSGLAGQIVNGAPADVFASADLAQLDRVAEAGLVAGDPAVFATNHLQIAVAPGNPLGIREVADLADPDVALVVCAPQVPCGAAAAEVEAAAGVTLAPVSEGPDARSVLGQVATGNADAGLVFVTDVASAAGEVEGVAIPQERNAVTEYPIATMTDAADPELARMFIEFVRGEDGTAVLAAAGFSAP